MAGFENYAQDTHDIELEIERKGVALGIDWHDEEHVRALAREALDFAGADEREKSFDEQHPDYARLAKIELFGLAGLMLRTMQESAATAGFESHGGDAWKAFARALWAEKKLRQPG
ncbi:hypothetical protein [Zoogloea sp.]|jgi:hypothetical protein|uniref:hypothetical protein n=1 Tax=Zoogloea sp. TaxID=49181 RepID=UPI0035B3B550